MDVAYDRRLLAGFREMLVARLGDGHNLTWPGLIRRLTAGRGTDDAVLVPALFDLLDEFLERQSRPEGAALLYDEYLTWLRAQSWYSGPQE